jgi:hypothetical protein
MLKVPRFYNFLHQEFPECTFKNEYREIIFFSTMIILAIGQHPLESVSKKFFLKIIPLAKFPIGSEGRESKAHMMGERIFKILMNIICVSALYKILTGEDCDFLDIRIGGRVEKPLYFNNYPCQKLP